MFYSYDKVKLGIEFRRIRLESKLSQKKISEISGVNKDTIRRIEKGEVIPRYDTLLALSKAYKRDLIGLMRYISPSFEVTCFYDEMDRQIIKFDISKQMRLENKLKEILQWVGKESFANQDEISQLFYLSKAIKNYHIGNFVEAKKQVLESLKNSIPTFSLKSLHNFRYTMLEKRLLLLLSVIIITENDIQSSNIILLHLLELSDQNIIMSILEVKMLLKVLLNLSYNYHRLSDSNRALIYSNRGINLALEYDLIYLVGHFLFRKGIAQYHLEISEYTKTLSQSITILIVSNNNNLADIYKKSLNENYNIQI